MRRLALYILSLVQLLTVSAADIRTIRAVVNGDDQLPPVLTLGTEDRLEVSFDELGTDRRYINYELQHCDASWQPSRLVEGEWLDGFNLGHVEDYAYSRATLVPYVHYSLVLPNDEMRITRTGNYKVRFFDENDPDVTLVVVPFMVTDQSAAVSGTVDMRTDIDYRQVHQQLSLAIGTRDASINDPFADLTVVIEQDGRRDNTITLTHPSRVRGREAIYEHSQALIFPAGNEYRRFETLSTYNTYRGVEANTLSGGMYHVILEMDHPRADKSYQYDQTQYGRLRPRRDDSYEADTEADYVLVHFTLEAPYMTDRRVFIDGDLTGRALDESSAMEYDHERGAYTKTQLLKQGAYNYQYLALPATPQVSATAPIEGDKYQTSHEYLVKVYARRPDERADRLVAVRRLYPLRGL